MAILGRRSWRRVVSSKSKYTTKHLTVHEETRSKVGRLMAHGLGASETISSPSYERNSSHIPFTEGFTVNPRRTSEMESSVKRTKSGHTYKRIPRARHDSKAVIAFASSGITSILLQLVVPLIPASKFPLVLTLNPPACIDGFHSG